MHTFPSDPTLRKLWIRVARPSQPTWVPAKGDCLCTDHFAEEDYVRSPAVLRSLGLPVKHVFLKPGVVPSLFTRKRKQAQLSGVEEKRRREEVIDELLKEPPQATVTETTEVVLNASTSFAAYTEQSPKAQHDPIKETSTGTEEPCLSLSSCTKNADQAPPRLRSVITQTSGLHKNECIQVTPETSSRHTQTNPVVVTPQCSSPNHVPQAQLDWTLPDGQKQFLTSPSLPLVPPEPPQPPEPPTVVEEDDFQDDLEDVDGDSLKELQSKHVEADVSYRPSDASFRMMLSDNSLRDDHVNTACQDNTSTSGGAVDYISERKFITFESCLDELLMRCPKCTALMRTSRKKVKGTCLFVYRTCANGHELVWSSQPCVHRRPLGSILLAAATLFSGSVVKKVLRLLNKMGVPCFSYRTYFNIQSSFLLPAIRRSNETKGSWAMELEGLKRTLVVFEANGLIVESIITDRHSMIKSFLSKDHPQIRHMFDCWHVAKGIKKRLVTAGKLKSLSALQDWVEPIVKHLYWCAESSDGAPEEILPKWTSLVAHVADVHEHADAIYPRCQHGDLGRKKWLSEAAQEANATDAPPPLSSNFERPDKNSLIAKHRSRFNC
ncbi:hypothetical protein ISCGN_002617 [Ixodes scapularis]